MPGRVEGSGGAAACESVAVESSGASMNSGVEVHCAFCDLIIVGEAVVCACCGGSFHADVTCVGVDEEVIGCLLRVKNGALQYFCCRCRSRVNDQNSVPLNQSGSSVEQLLKVVGALSGKVREMMNKIEGYNRSHGDVGAGELASKNWSREDMRIELRELHEQEKRQCSVVLRGFSSTSQEVVKRKFVDICVLLNVGNIELSGLSRIEETGLFRAKIMDKEKTIIIEQG